MATMEKILEQARITLSNATSDPQLLARLSVYGYGSAKLQEGMALYELARVSVQAQSNARSNKAKTQQAFQKTCKLAQVHYRNDLNIARIALKDQADAQVLLQLNSKSGKTFAARHAQAREFYFGLLKARVLPLNASTAAFNTWKQLTRFVCNNTTKAAVSRTQSKSAMPRSRHLPAGWQPFAPSPVSPLPTNPPR